MSFGENLQFMRKVYNGMTQEELAEQMNVSRQTVSKWEMDVAYPEIEKAIALSKLFNCTLDELYRVKAIARQMGIDEQKLQVVGWDFPFVSQEQRNIFYMHGYCAACILPEDCENAGEQILSQPSARYAAITIEKPFEKPFVVIPNAYKTLERYLVVNGLKHSQKKEILECFEKEYEVDGTSYMDVYIAVE